MHIIGLTGGIASGKTTVGKYLQNSGLPVIDADEVARVVVRPGTPTYFSIVDRFGLGILTNDSQIDRPTLGQIIFNNKEKRDLLNSLVHPAIRLEIVQRSLWYFLRGHRAIVLDTPLLFESGMHRFVTCTLVVYVPPHLQKQRLMQRNGLNAGDAQARINSQMPIEKKKDLATYVVDNSGTMSETREQVDRMLPEFRTNWLFRAIIYVTLFWPCLCAYCAIHMANKLDSWGSVGIIWKRQVPAPHSTFLYSKGSDIALAAE